MDNHYDILIVGCGLVGASLAKALCHCPKKIAIIDAKTPQPLTEAQTRPISLSYGSHLILKRYGLWETLAAHTTPIHTVHISEKGHFGVTKLQASDMEVDALGYVVPLHSLYNTLQQSLNKQTNLTLITPNAVTDATYIRDGMKLTLQDDTTLTAKLVIAADGTHSAMRQLMQIGVDCVDNQEHAIVATLSAQHQNVAYERFTKLGVIALLPQAQNRVGLVWTSKDPQTILALDDTAFLTLLQKQIGYRLGKLHEVSARHSHPLKTLLAKEQTRPHFVLLGNAAHTLYPLAAQGFNLSLGDLATLADVIASEKPLATYDALRQRPQQQIAWLTQSLSSIFTHHNKAATLARNIGLLAFDHCLPIKRKLTKLTMGLSEPLSVAADRK